jgi:hypothetical protein
MSTKLQQVCGHLCAIAVIGVSVYATFSDLLIGGCEWLDLDDHENFRDNEYIKAFSVSNAMWAIKDGTILGVYEPVSLLFKTLVSVGFGHTIDQFLLVNFGLHLLCSVGAYLLSTALLRMAQRGGLSALQTACLCASTTIMAVSPLRVEVVAWASCQPILLACLLSQLSLLAHLSHLSRHPPGALSAAKLLSALAFFLATLSKAAALSVVGAVVCVDVLLHSCDPKNARGGCGGMVRAAGRSLRHNWLLLPLAGLSAGFAMSASHESDMAVRGLSSVESLLRACFMPLYYLLHTAAPRAALLTPRLLVPGPDALTPSAPLFGGCLVAVLLASAGSAWVVLGPPPAWTASPPGSGSVQGKAKGKTKAKGSEADEDDADDAMLAAAGGHGRRGLSAGQVRRASGVRARVSGQDPG